MHTVPVTIRQWCRTLHHYYKSARVYIQGMMEIANLHTSGLVEHSELFFRKAAYWRYGAPSKMFRHITVKTCYMFFSLYPLHSDECLYSSKLRSVKLWEQELTKSLWYETSRAVLLPVETSAAACILKRHTHLQTKDNLFHHITSFRLFCKLNKHLVFRFPYQFRSEE